MKGTRSNSGCVLAVYPTSKGFGFVVLDSPTALVEWAVKTVTKDKESKTLKKVSELIRLYRPAVLILEEPQQSRRCKRIQDLVLQVKELAGKEGVKCRCFKLSRVKDVFTSFRARTKHEIAQVIAQQLPELAGRLPPKRKPWTSEDYRMAMFDAAALALTYFYSRPVRGRVDPVKDRSGSVQVPNEANITD